MLVDVCKHLKNTLSWKLLDVQNNDLFWIPTAEYGRIGWGDPASLWPINHMMEYSQLSGYIGILRSGLASQICFLANLGAWQAIEIEFGYRYWTCGQVIHIFHTDQLHIEPEVIARVYLVFGQRQRGYDVLARASPVS